MNILSTRQKDIIKYLLKESNFVSTKQISEKFQVSEKTIYRELKIIKEELKKKDILLDKKQGRGVLIEGSIDNGMILNYDLNKNIEIIETTSVQERRADILLELLRNTPTFTSITKLSEKYYISRTSIVNDILYLEKELKNYNLVLEKNNLGTRIIGSEKDIRNMIVNIVNSSIHEKALKEDYIISQRIGESTFKELEIIFSKEDIINIEKLVNEAEIQLNYTIAESYYINFVTYILILIQRLRDGNNLYKNIEKMLIEKKTYKIAKNMANKIETLYLLKLPEEEIYFIYQYLVSSGVGSIIQSLNMPILLNQVDEKVKNIVMELNQKMYKIVGVRMCEELELYESLILHIKAMLNRLSYNIKIKNPLLDNIKNEFSDLFNFVGMIMLPISKKYNLPEINENEISYLSVYFQAILEEKMAVTNIIIVCSSGIGSSYLLKNRIKTVFHDWNIKNIISLEKLNNKYDLSDIDLIISTIKIPKVNKPIAYVSVLLDKKDIELINKIFLDFNRKNKTENQEINLFQLTNYQIKSVENTSKKKFESIRNKVLKKISNLELLDNLDLRKIKTSNDVNIEFFSNNIDLEKVKIGFIYIESELNTIILNMNTKYQNQTELFKLINNICKDSNKKESILRLINSKNILKKDNINLNLNLLKKDEFYNVISKELKEKNIIFSEKVFTEELKKRENLGSIFIGKGIVLPHIISSNINESNIYILRNKQKINWDEKQNVKCIILIILKKKRELDISLDSLVISNFLEDISNNIKKDILLYEDKDTIFSEFKIL